MWCTTEMYIRTTDSLCFLVQVAHPVRNIMDRWIYDGELEDQYQEVSNICYEQIGR